MKLNVKKSGINDKGVWVYGTADLGGFEITALYSCNLKEPLKVGETVQFKKIKIYNGNKAIFYSLEF